MKLNPCSKCGNTAPHHAIEPMRYGSFRKAIGGYECSACGNLAVTVLDQGDLVPRKYAEAWNAANPVAPKADAPWTKWRGGKCPVSPETRVKVQRRNGITSATVAGLEYWTHAGTWRDIVAYRIINQPES